MGVGERREGGAGHSPASHSRSRSPDARLHLLAARGRPVTKPSLAGAPAQSFESLEAVPKALCRLEETPKDSHGAWECYFILQKKKRTLWMSSDSECGGEAITLGILGAPNASLVRGRVHAERESKVTTEAATGGMQPQAKECWHGQGWALASASGGGAAGPVPDFSPATLTLDFRPPER